MSTIHFQLTFKMLECYIMDSSVRHANTIFFYQRFLCYIWRIFYCKNLLCICSIQSTLVMEALIAFRVCWLKSPTK